MRYIQRCVQDLTNTTSIQNQSSCVLEQSMGDCSRYVGPIKAFYVQR